MGQEEEHCGAVHQLEGDSLDIESVAYQTGTQHPDGQIEADLVRVVDEQVDAIAKHGQQEDEEEAVAHEEDVEVPLLAARLLRRLLALVWHLLHYLLEEVVQVRLVAFQAGQVHLKGDFCLSESGAERRAVSQVSGR